MSEGMNLSVLIPTGLLDTIKKADPVRIGGATGFNAVLTTDPKPTSETTTDTAGPVFAGGNPAGYASITREGIHPFTVDFAITDLYAPVYIVTATGVLDDTDNSGANPLFGWAMNTKAATSGELLVLIKSN